MMNFFLKASANEIVPLLRRMEEAVHEGKTVQEAYAEALHETRVLKNILGEPPPDLPFGEALIEGATHSQLRPLAELAATFRPDGAAASAAAGASRRQKQLFIAGVAVGSLLVLRLLRR
jgi:hypothetical protein